MDRRPDDFAHLSQGFFGCLDSQQPRKPVTIEIGRLVKLFPKSNEDTQGYFELRAHYLEAIAWSWLGWSMYVACML